jgi:hypothetical protein
MTPHELETSYTALANAIHEVGPDKAKLMLTTLCLRLISERDDAAPVLQSIAEVVSLTKQ